MQRLLVGVIVVLVQLAVAGAAAASRELVHAYPPVGLAEVVGVSPGSTVLRTMQRYSIPAFTDLLVMHVAATLQATGEGPVTVNRRLGQRGLAAALAVAVATPDGRTLLLASSVPARPHSTDRVHIVAVAAVATMPYVLVTGAERLPASLRELIEAARTPGARLLVASAGGTSISHRALEHLRRKRAPGLEPVAYNGGTAALQAVIVQEVDAALAPLPAVLPHAAGGRVRLLAIAEARRHPIIPHVATAIEAGAAGLDVIGWFAVFAPGATPQRALREIEGALALGAEAGDAREIFSSFGLRIEHVPAETFAPRLARHAP
jgi:tripartite-type tricarboxylate transporter receptor subunit TctC